MAVKDKTTVVPAPAQPAAQTKQPVKRPVAQEQPAATSREHDPDFQYFIRMMLGDQAEQRQQNEQELQEFVQAISEAFGVKTSSDLTKKGILSVGDILSVERNDSGALALRVAEVTDYSSGQRRYLTGRALDDYLVNQGISRPSAPAAAHGAPSTGVVGSVNPNPPVTFRLSSVGDIQKELISSIDRAAKITGVPAALLGAMSGIESRFGKDSVSPTGALGIFQQTTGYMKDNWRAFGSTIAQHVPEARAALAGGLDRDEMRRLAFNSDASALMTALAAKRFAKDYGLDLNDKRTWGLVYAEHNSGRGSVDKLLAGGMTDKWIRDVNPAVYRGVDGSSQSVLASFQSKVMSWAKNYEALETRIAGVQPTAPQVTAAASVRPPNDTVVMVASLDKPTPKPS